MEEKWKKENGWSGSSNSGKKGKFYSFFRFYKQTMFSYNRQQHWAA
jgi:hypothetical protein